MNQEMPTMKTVICNAFVSLMLDEISKSPHQDKYTAGYKALDKITVTAITRAAHCNRRTFYTYFHDIYDLFDQISTKYVSGFEALLKHDMRTKGSYITSSAVYETVNRFIDYLDENQQGILVVSIINEQVFIDMIQKVVKRILFSRLDAFKQLDRYRDEDPEMIKVDLVYTNIFISSGISQICHHWLMGRDKVSLNKLKQLVDMFVVNLLTFFQGASGGSLEPYSKLFGKQLNQRDVKWFDHFNPWELKLDM